MGWPLVLYRGKLERRSLRLMRRHSSQSVAVSFRLHACPSRVFSVPGNPDFIAPPISFSPAMVTPTSRINPTRDCAHSPSFFLLSTRTQHSSLWRGRGVIRSIDFLRFRRLASIQTYSVQTSDPGLPPKVSYSTHASSNQSCLPHSPLLMNRPPAHDGGLKAITRLLRLHVQAA